MQNNRAVGSEYEKKASAYLVDKGYEILCYNYRCPVGEIDIVAKDGEELVFVEVKFRKNLGKGNPLESVTYQKQKVISKCARYYMVSHYKYEVPCRFDVIGILGGEITHIVQAFPCV